MESDKTRESTSRPCREYSLHDIYGRFVSVKEFRLYEARTFIGGLFELALVRMGMRDLHTRIEILGIGNNENITLDVRYNPWFNVHYQRRVRNKSICPSCKYKLLTEEANIEHHLIEETVARAIFRPELVKFKPRKYNNPELMYGQQVVAGIHNYRNGLLSISFSKGLRWGEDEVGTIFRRLIIEEVRLDYNLYLSTDVTSNDPLTFYFNN